MHGEYIYLCRLICFKNQSRFPIQAIEPEHKRTLGVPKHAVRTSGLCTPRAGTELHQVTPGWAAHASSCTLALLKGLCRTWKITNFHGYDTACTHKLSFLLTLSTSKNLHVQSAAITVQVTTTTITYFDRVHSIFCLALKECISQSHAILTVK